MPRSLLNWVTAILGCYFLGVGIGCLLLPERMAEQFSVSTHGVHGLSTIRGDLGGMFLAMGAMSLVGYRVKWHGSRYLYAVTLLLAAIALARLPGLLLDGFDPFTLALALIELAMGTIFLLAAREASAAEQRG